MFKHELVKMKSRLAEDETLTAAGTIAEALDAGDFMKQIEVLYQVRAVFAYSTAICERGFSKMKLIKSYLRNRLYIETLDALYL